MIIITESDDPIDICRDNVFKAVFTKDSPQSRGALSKLLSAVIGRDLTVVSITSSEPPIDNLRDRQVRFDLTCKGDDGSLSNVEVSLNPDKCEPVRLEFYAGKLFTGQDIRGTDKTYDGLKDTYQIAILVNGRFFDGDDFLYKLGGRTHVITLELSKQEYLMEKPIEKMSAAERWAFYIDTQSRIAYAKREGRWEGEQIGERRGRQEGIGEILKLMDAGYSPEQIRERLKLDER
jgi:hypothetical protein